MCPPRSSSRMQGTIHEVAWQRCLELDLSLCGQNGGLWRRPEPPPAIPAAESALGLRPRIALSSAQVLPEWITSTSPRNDFSSNGDYPLNFVSHWKGSPQTSLSPTLTRHRAGKECPRDCAVCDKQPKKGNRNSSPLCSTT